MAHHTKEEAIRLGIPIREALDDPHRRKAWNDYFMPGRYGVTFHLDEETLGGIPTQAVLGTIEGDCASPSYLGGNTPNPAYPHIVLSDVGRMVESAISHLQDKEDLRDVHVIATAIMPTHVHLVVEVTHQLPQRPKRNGTLRQLTLGDAVRYIKSSSTSMYWRWLRGEDVASCLTTPRELSPYATPSSAASGREKENHAPTGTPTTQAGTQQGATYIPTRAGTQQGATYIPTQAGTQQGTTYIPTQAGTQQGTMKQCVKDKKSGRNRKRTSDDGLPPLWEQNYNDLVLYHYNILTDFILYVKANAFRWRLRDQYPHLFEHRLHLSINGLDYSGWGCMFLLKRPERVQVKCHRLARKGMLTTDEWKRYTASWDIVHQLEQTVRAQRLGHYDSDWLQNTSHDCICPIPYTETEAFRRQKENLLDKARTSHAVLVSPSVSRGEQDIIRSALQEGIAVIKLQAKPFTGKNHPTGYDIDYCAREQMLVLGPWYIPNVIAQPPTAEKRKDETYIAANHEGSNITANNLDNHEGSNITANNLDNHERSAGCATSGSSYMQRVATESPESEYTRFHNLNKLAERMCAESITDCHIKNLKELR